MEDSPSPPEEQHVFVLVGLPGSGKSTAAEIIESELQSRGEAATFTEVSDFVRTHCEAHGWSGDLSTESDDSVENSTDEPDESLNDNDLGRVAANIKDDRGEDFFVRRMAEQWQEADRHVIISGIRSPEEGEAVRDVYGAENVTIISIWTLPDIRFERKYGDCPSEEHPKYDEFCERNERETFTWRCVEYFEDMELSDYIVPNNDDVSQLESNLSCIISNEITDATSRIAESMADTPFPRELETEEVAQYL